jgi:hypothetical protein
MKRLQLLEPTPKRLTPEQLNAHLDYLIETYGLPDTPLFRQALVELAELETRPPISWWEVQGAKLAAWWQDHHDQVTTLLVVGTVLVPLVFLLRWAVGAYNQAAAQERQAQAVLHQRLVGPGLPYQERFLVTTTDHHPVEVVLWTHLKGAGIPWAQDQWDRCEQRKQSVQFLISNIENRTLQEVLNPEVQAQLKRRLFEKLSQTPDWFQRGTWWVEGITLTLQEPATLQTGPTAPEVRPATPQAGPIR